LKVFELLTRRADMTLAQAMEYWTEQHAALVKQRMAGHDFVRQYLNNVGLTDQPSAQIAPFDGVVTAHLRLDPDRFAAQISTPGNPVVADELNFLSRPPIVMLVEEHRIVTLARPTPTKLMVFLRRLPNLTCAVFETLLLDRFVPAAQEVWGAKLRGFGVNFGRALRSAHWGSELALYDAVIELWLDMPPSNVATALTNQASRIDPTLNAIAQAPAYLQVREVRQIDLPLDD
jgi:hypothetical protein